MLSLRTKSRRDTPTKGSFRLQSILEASRPIFSGMSPRLVGQSWCVRLSRRLRVSIHTDLPFIQNATILYPAPYGALTQLFAGTMPEALNFNGEVRRFLMMIVPTTCPVRFHYVVPHTVGPPWPMPSGGVRRCDWSAFVDVA